MRISLLIILLLGYGTAQASQAMLERFFVEVKTLQAEFEQTVLDEDGNVLDTANGTFYLSRPGKFRWDYRHPDPGISMGQQIVADGKSIYMFDPELEQVTQRSMKDALLQVPSLVLVQKSEKGALAKLFDIRDTGNHGGQSWVTLKPKTEDAAYQQLEIGFRNGSFDALSLVDGLGNTTQLRLSKVDKNTRLPSSKFKFKVPASADLLVE